MQKYIFPSRSVRSLIYLTSSRFWTVERFVFLAQTPGCAALRHHTKKNLHAFTLFFITCRSENVRHIYHYLFIRAPFQMRSLAYRLLLQAAVFIQLFDSPKRASGEIPTDRASRCSLPRHPLHFQYSPLFANKKWPPSIFVWIGFVDRLQPASISGTSVICWPSLATTESHAAATSPPV